MSDALTAAHRWGLARVRTAFNATLSHRDKALPALAARTVVELPGSAGPLEGRFYRPAGVAADAPILLYFHGGGFVCSSLDTHEALCIRLADAGPIRLLAASYRLAPEHRFPAQLEDALSVARWLAAQGQPFAVGGDSAGGYLAASVAARMPDAVTAQLLLYPLVHLDEDVWTESLLRHTRLIGWAAVRYIRAQLLDIAPSLLSPGAVAALPTVIATGEVLDPTREDALALAERLLAAGAPVELREYPGFIHGFGNLTHVSAAARSAVAELGALAGQAIHR
jgi:acetyl esterase